ncbi:hypothetical protein B0T22DRAFT_440492 [Podospora appendiculata]|uniref:Uncharacterized protein n=1 Tax=Podospora appendiculata TaxID=314037 RepID=A0AAE1CCY0_9PEZI|nr:hypothetical protein B0T22DRAFT_440492 [Podospora appendiculata]
MFARRRFAIGNCFSGMCWFWGSWTYNQSAGESSVTAFAQSCNETIEAVDVNVTFVGKSLAIDPLYPLIPDESSARSPPIDISLFEGYLMICREYGYLTTWNLIRSSNRVESTDLFDRDLIDDFNLLLTSSRYAIPIGDFAGPTKAEKVATAMRFQHRIVRAQSLSMNWRVPVNSTKPGPIPMARQPIEEMSYPARITIPNGATKGSVGNVHGGN